jgi:hypothetical protein
MAALPTAPGWQAQKPMIAGDERPCRQLVVEPSHAGFSMSARDAPGFRDLSAPALPKGRKIYEMIRDRPKQFELHPPIPHLDYGSLKRRRPEERWLRMKLFDITADGDGFGNECPVIKFEQRHSAHWVRAKILGG